MPNVLVVEDSADTHHVIAMALGPLQLQVVPTESVGEAESQLSNSDFSYVILDLGLPDGNGIEILNKIRSDANLKNMPVMILSADTDISSKLNAFLNGADDYLTKPFNPLELRARVDSKLRRLSQVGQTENQIVAGPLVLEANTLVANVTASKVAISLSSIEFRIIALLARKPGHLFSRDAILKQIWGANVHVSDRTIDTHIYTLRKKLGQFSGLIKSVQGEGYLFLTTKSH